MVIHNNVSSKSYNTFGISVNIPALIEIKRAGQLWDLLDVLPSRKFHVLGSGSNVLLTSEPVLPVVHINTKGIEVVKEAEDYVLVKFQAGEQWHDAVLWAVAQGYGGIENLSLIPGRCGAAPMQNIGAYGVEIKDVLHSLSAFNIEKGVEFTFHNEECGFGYRTSNFKTAWKNQYVITDIILRLTKSGHHEFKLSYGAISSELEKLGHDKPSIKNISDVVISIRQSKLPDPKVVGNAGSFFKNPVIPISILERIKQDYPTVPSYPIDSEWIKLPAAWLIDTCGWKGRVVGNTGTYKNQALVIVNHGDATGAEIQQVSFEIQKSVKDKFGIELEPEVNVWS